MRADSKFDCRCVDLVMILRQWKGNGKAECEDLHKERLRLGVRCVI